MKTIDSYIDEIIVKEGNGKYTNDPKDSGGPTRWGITEKTARKYGYTGDMELLPRETAVAIYKSKYWTKPKFDLINNIHPELAFRLLDFGVLAGQTTSAKMLQRALNVLNRNGRDYPDIVVDGDLGAKTREALNQFYRVRGKDGKNVLLGLVASQQSVYLMELAERRPKDEEYSFGWQLNRAIGAILK